MVSRQGKRGPDKKPRKQRAKKDVERVQLSLTPGNAAFLRYSDRTNSDIVNGLIDQEIERLRECA